MKLQKWALIAEIVAGVAIVFTLVVLIIETRQNTAATYATSYDAIAADMVDWRKTLATDAQVLSDYMTFIGVQEEVDSGRDYSPDAGMQMATALFMIYERAYFARQYGRLGDSEWARYQSGICGDVAGRVFPILSRDSDGGRRWFTDEFVAFADSCAK